MAAAVQVASLFVSIGANLQGLNKGLGDAQNKLRQAGSSLMGIGTKLTMGVTAPLLGLGTAAVKMAGDFEEQMGLMEIAARGAGGEFDTMREFALKMGATTIYNAREMADAMTGLFKAGMNAEEVMGDLSGETGAMAAASDLATASNLSLAQAADAIAIAMATFGLNAEDAVGITNNFVQAADASVAEVSGLVDAMRNVGPVAASFGWSLEDTNTALALLSERGITGGEAGTALRSMMTNLMRPTKAVTETLAELNVSLFDQEGALKPLPMIINDLSQALAGATEEQRLQAIQTLSGTYGMRAMNTLLDEGLVGWAEMEAAVQKAATAEEVADVKTSSLAGVLEEMGGALETAGIQIGELLLPLIKDLVKDHIIPLIDRIGELNPETIKMGLAIAGVAAVAGPLLIALGALVTVVGALLSPIGLVVLALAGLGVAYATNFLGFKDAVDEVLPRIVEFGQTAALWLGENIPIAMEAISQFWNETLRPAIEEIALWLGENIPIAMQAISDFWYDTLQPALSDFWDWMTTHVQPAVEAISRVVIELVRIALEAFWIILTEKIIPAVTDAWDWIKNKLTPSAETMQGVMATLTGVLDAVAGALDWIAEQAGKAADALEKVKPGTWFQGKSASPFEASLRGITDAALEATRAVQGLDGMPAGNFGGLTPATAMAGAGGGSPQIIVVNLDRRDFEGPDGELDYGAIGQQVMGGRLY
jgi:TP901 family phage tail tape measure protein